MVLRSRATTVLHLYRISYLNLGEREESHECPHLGRVSVNALAHLWTLIQNKYPRTCDISHVLNEAR